MKRRFAACCAIVVVLLSTATSAQAALGISLSRDGVTWSSQLDGPLFDGATRWVPGDRRVETFWVRNDSDEPAELLLDVKNTAVHDLYDTGDLTIEARSEGPWIPIRDTETQRLISQSAADAGEARRVDVAVTFDRLSDNQSQVLRLQLAFGMRLIDSDVVIRGTQGDFSIGTAGTVDPDGDGTDGSSGSTGGSSISGPASALPDTGNPLSLLVPLVGAGCLLAGIVLAARPRRGTS